MDEMKACQHCYARIVKVGRVWVDIENPSVIHCEGEPRLTHKPMPDILKEEHAN